MERRNGVFLLTLNFIYKFDLSHCHVYFLWFFFKHFNFKHIWVSESKVKDGCVLPKIAVVQGTHQGYILNWKINLMIRKCEHLLKSFLRTSRYDLGIQISIHCTAPSIQHPIPSIRSGPLAGGGGSRIVQQSYLHRLMSYKDDPSQAAYASWTQPVPKWTGETRKESKGKLSISNTHRVHMLGEVWFKPSKHCTSNKSWWKLLAYKFNGCEQVQKRVMKPPSVRCTQDIIHHLNQSWLDATWLVIGWMVRLRRSLASMWSLSTFKRKRKMRS